MTGWIAIIPFKPAGMRKTRLAARLSVQERDLMCERMLAGVIHVLAGIKMIEDIVLLARDKPSAWQHSWVADGGSGLNPELDKARNRLHAKRLMVIHADLPFLQQTDIAALTLQNEKDCTIAPDRHGLGTNALALQDFPDFTFCFGEASLRRHMTAGGGRLCIVERPGLAFDIDTITDFEEAERRGFSA